MVAKGRCLLQSRNLSFCWDSDGWVPNQQTWTPFQSQPDYGLRIFISWKYERARTVNRYRRRGPRKLYLPWYAHVFYHPDFWMPRDWGFFRSSGYFTSIEWPNAIHGNEFPKVPCMLSLWPDRAPDNDILLWNWRTSHWDVCLWLCWIP